MRIPNAGARTCVVLVVLLSAPGAPATPPDIEAAKRRLLGVQGPPYPSEFEDLGGSLLDLQVTNRVFFASTGIEHLRTATADFFAIEKLLTEIQAPHPKLLTEPAPHPLWEIVDVLAVPAPPKGQELWEENCALDGEDEVVTRLIAVALEGPEPNWSGKVLHAWQPDVKTRRWVDVPGERVRCGTDEDVD